MQCRVYAKKRTIEAAKAEALGFHWCKTHRRYERNHKGSIPQQSRDVVRAMFKNSDIKVEFTDELNG